MTVFLCTSAQAQIASDQAVNYQINATHTGSVYSAGLTLPLKQKWSVNFGQNISYPIIAGGKVFVTVRYASVYGTKLYALDGATGAIVWGPIDLGGSYWMSALCYENGRVFALNSDGLLRAFDAASGNVIWSRQLTSSPFLRGRREPDAGGRGHGQGRQQRNVHLSAGQHRPDRSVHGRNVNRRDYLVRHGQTQTTQSTKRRVIYLHRQMTRRFSTPL